MFIAAPESSSKYSPVVGTVVMLFTVPTKFSASFKFFATGAVSKLRVTPQPHASVGLVGEVLTVVTYLCCEVLEVPACGVGEVCGVAEVCGLPLEVEAPAGAGVEVERA